MNNLKRIHKEMTILTSDPPEGIVCWPRDTPGSTATDNNPTATGVWIDAVIHGPPNTPYENASFNVNCQFPSDYPLAPPSARFCTPIYHPNIDKAGRICIDILKEGSQPGNWNPVRCNMRMALAQIRQLLAEPNPDDPLDADIAHEFKFNYPAFALKAQSLHGPLSTSSPFATKPGPPPSLFGHKKDKAFQLFSRRVHVPHQHSAAQILPPTCEHVRAAVQPPLTREHQSAPVHLPILEKPTVPGGPDAGSRALLQKQRAESILVYLHAHSPPNSNSALRSQSPIQPLDPSGSDSIKSSVSPQPLTFLCPKSPLIVDDGICASYAHSASHDPICDRNPKKRVSELNLEPSVKHPKLNTYTRNPPNNGVSSLISFSPNPFQINPVEPAKISNSASIPATLNVPHSDSAPLTNPLKSPTDNLLKPAPRSLLGNVRGPQMPRLMQGNNTYRSLVPKSNKPMNGGANSGSLFGGINGLFGNR